MSDATLNRFFSFHVIAIPLVLIGLVAAHLVALHEVGSNNPDGVDREGPRGPIRPPRTASVPPILHGARHHGRGGLLIIFAAIVFFGPEMGGYFLEYNNFLLADPLKTPPHRPGGVVFHAVLPMLRPPPTCSPGLAGRPSWAPSRAAAARQGRHAHRGAGHPGGGRGPAAHHRRQFWGRVAMAAVVILFFCPGCTTPRSSRSATGRPGTSGVRHFHRQLPGVGLSGYATA